MEATFINSFVNGTLSTAAELDLTYEQDGDDEYNDSCSRHEDHRVRVRLDCLSHGTTTAGRIGLPRRNVR